VSNTVTIQFKVVQDGKGFKIIGQEAEKTAKQTDKATKSTGKYNKGQKGVAQAGMNSTKAFSKMRSEMGGSSGVVAAYATFAANVFALTAAFGALQRAAQLQNLEEGFERLGNAVGRTSTMMAESIQTITDGAISFDQAMRTAATGFSAGFSTSEIDSLARVARGAATALGRDLPDALDRLVRGTAKLEPEILDELGIFVKINDAATKYADTLGKSASQLTAVQRRQAFLNEAISQGEKKFGAIAEEVEVNTYDQLAANFDKLAKSALNLFSNVLSPVIGFLANNTTALLGTLILFGSTLASSMFPALTKMAAKQRDVAASTKEMAQEEAKRQKKTADMATASFLKKPSAATTAEGRDFKAVAALKKDLRAGTANSKSFDKALKSINSTMKRTETIAKKNKKLEDKAHKARMAQLEAQKQKILDLQKAQEGKTRTSRKAQGLSLFAEADEGVAGGLERIGEQDGGLKGVRKGFSIANEEFKSFKDKTRKGFKVISKDAKGFGKIGFVLKKAFKMGAVGARLFGAALVNAIPLIGQIIFIVGLAVEALGKLFKALTRPTKAEAQLAEITEKLKGKTEQLAETNEKLADGFQKIELNRIVREGGELTDEMFDQAVAVGDARAEVRAYANELAVAAGVLDEFSASVGNLADELAERENEGGVLAVLSNFTGDIVEGTGDFFKDLGKGIVNLGKGAVEEIENAGKVIYEETGSASRFLIGLFGGEEALQALDMAGVKATMKTFREETIGNFEKIKETLDDAEIASLVENVFAGQSLEEYIDAQLKTVDLTGTQEQANIQLEKVMKRVQASISGAAKELQKQSDSINKFDENVKDASAALRAFAVKAKESNKFTVLGENLQLVTNAVNALRDTAKASEGEFTFAQLLEEQVLAGNIKLEEFGTTLKEVVANVDAGKDPFEGLGGAIANAADQLMNGKAKLEEFKAELKTLQAVAKQTKDLDTFSRSMKNFDKFGSFGLTGKDKFENAIPDFEKRLAMINKEEEIKNNIAKQQADMNLASLEVLRLQNLGNADILTQIQKQKDGIIAQRDAQIELNKAKGDQATIDAGFDFQRGEDARVAETLSAAGTGDTVYDRVESFQKAGGMDALEKKDADGIVSAGSGLQKTRDQLTAMNEMIGPQIESLKKLGPEGELVAAVTEGSFVIGDAFLAMSQKLEKAGTGMEKGAAMAAFAGQMIGQVNSMLAAQSKAKIANIDKEISAEKARDGKSQASVAKLEAMEKKKVAMKRKAFETNKKMQLAQTLISTASAVMSVMDDVSPPYNFVLAGLVAALGAKQMALINSTSFQGGAGSADPGPSKISLGSRKNTVDLAKGNNAGGELGYARGEQGVGKGMTSFRPAFAGAKHRAGGGYVVGEQGPEVFMPEVPGNIIPAGQGVGGTTNVNFSINAVDTAGVEELLSVQRGNIISMIREAANEHGEFFLENIDTEAYGV